MKKYLLIYIVVPLVGILLVQYVLERYYQQHATQKFTRIYRHEIDPEIMIFGSSVALHEFDPHIIKEKTGMSAYNMGFDGLFFVQYEALIDEYLDYEKNCKYIVIGNDFENLGKNYLITRPDIFLAYINNNYVYNALHEMEPQSMFRARYIPGYLLTCLNKSFYKDILFPERTPDSLLGFDPIDKAFDGKDNPKPWEARYEDHIYDKLRACVAKINRKGIKVVFVMTPFYVEGYKTVMNADFIKDKFKALAGDSVYFMDYTTDTLCQKKEYFTNYSHLNRTGAALFSGMFSNDLLHTAK